MEGVGELRIELPRLHAGQRRVLAEAVRFNVAMCGRRWGKTQCGIDIAVNGVLDGELVGWFAPTYKILNPAFDELRGVLQGVPGFWKSESERTVGITGLGSVECWSMDTPDPGRSRKYHGVIVDEAGLQANLAQVFNESIRATLADYRGRCWFFGTPKGVGDFSAFFAKGQGLDGEWRSWRLPTSANPYILPAEIEAMRQGMPDAVFRQEVLAEVIDAGDHPIGLDAIAACVGEQSGAAPVVFGVDLARAVDFTAVIGLDAAGKVAVLERWKTPWGLTKARVERVVGNHIAYIDSTGVGDPVVEDLQRSGVRAIGHVFTARFKQQMVEHLITAIQRKQVHFPDGWLRAELDALRAEKTAVGTRYAGPHGADIHDDGVMALALAWLAYTKTVHAPRPPIADTIPVKQDDRAPHFNYATKRFERVSPMDDFNRQLQRTAHRPFVPRAPRVR